MQVLATKPLSASLRNNPYVVDFAMEALARKTLGPPALQTSQAVVVETSIESTTPTANDRASGSAVEVPPYLIWSADLQDSLVRENGKVMDILFGGFLKHKQLSDRLYKERPLHHVQLGETLRTKPDAGTQTVFELFQMTEDTEAWLKRAMELARARGVKEEEFTDCDVILAIAETSSGGDDSYIFNLDLFDDVHIPLTLKQVREAIAEVERQKVVLTPETQSALTKDRNPFKPTVSEGTVIAASQTTDTPNAASSPPAKSAAYP